jgi:hypothetical protein
MRKSVIFTRNELHGCSSVCHEELALVKCASVSDLIEILQHIEKRPGMYFQGGERSIHTIEAFILGFSCAREPAPNGRGELSFFGEWLAAHYEVVLGGHGLFSLILEHVNGDERKGWDEFFALLPQYLHDRKELGNEGIMARFDEVQNRLLEKS